MNNKQLYESDEVVEKYSANNTRLRSLNNPERELIDRFNVKDNNVLVLGSGGGRVPINLLLYGNRVTGVDRSQKLHDLAIRNFPKSKFSDLSFELADMTNLNSISDNNYNVIIFPMNSIDYLENYSLREKALLEAKKKLKSGGLLVFSSHNKLAYTFSPKINWRDRNFLSFFSPYSYLKESSVGGGCIFKGQPNFIIKDTARLTGFTWQGFICDNRHKLDKVFSRRLGLAQFYFPYIMYIFKKP